MTADTLRFTENIDALAYANSMPKGVIHMAPSVEAYQNPLMRFQVRSIDTRAELDNVSPEYVSATCQPDNSRLGHIAVDAMVHSANGFAIETDRTIRELFGASTIDLAAPAGRTAIISGYGLAA